MGIMSMLLWLVGCTRSSNSSEYEDKIKFSTYSQTEKKEYVEKALQSKYNDSFTVSTITQPQIDPFSSEAYFTTQVTQSNGYVFNVWIEPDGSMMDSKFIEQFEERITILFSSIISENFPESTVNTSTYLLVKPTHIWSGTEDVMEMLENETTFTDVKVILPDTIEIDQRAIESLLGKLTFCNGELLFYNYNKEADFNVDFDNLKLSDSIYKVKFEKES